MDVFFINHTNHPSLYWMDKQRQEAEKYGRILDLPFPEIDAGLDEASIAGLATGYAARISALRPVAVLCQGEYSYTYALVDLLKSSGIHVFSACSQRYGTEVVDAKGVVHRKSIFKFVRFRQY